MAAGQPILVVGASGSIGSSLVHQLTNAGHDVWGTASNPASLAAIPASAARTFSCNLSDESSIESLVTSITGATPALGGIIHAAGLAAFGSTTELPATALAKLMAVNFSGPARLTAALTPLLRAAEGGFIVSLSGKISELPTAGMAGYSASKAALYAYATAAGRELRRDGLRWLDARPGHTDTGFANRAIFGTAPAFGAGLTADAVAARIIRGIEAGERDLPSTEF